MLYQKDKFRKWYHTTFSTKASDELNLGLNVNKILENPPEYKSPAAATTTKTNTCQSCTFSELRLKYIDFLSLGQVLGFYSRDFKKFQYGRLRAK
jgi:hypothetical protein